MIFCRLDSLVSSLLIEFVTLLNGRSTAEEALVKLEFLIDD